MNDLYTASASPLSDASSAPNVGVLAQRDISEASLLQRYLRIARRWRWVVAATVVVSVVAALIITMLMTPQYSATVTIEIAREEARIVNVDGVQPKGASLDQEFYQTQYGLLQSQALAERVAQDLKLVDNRNFLQRAGIADASGVAGDERPLDNSAAARAQRMRRVVGVLLTNVTVVPTRQSRLVAIHYTNPDAAMAAQIANAWARLFILTNIERRFEATAYARNFLETRLSELRGKLDQSERELVQYAAQQRIVNVQNGDNGERPIISDDLVAYNTALAAARAQRIAAEAAMQQGERRGNSTSASVNNPTIAQMRGQRAERAAEYAKLRTQFEPGYPPLQAIQAQITQLDRAIGAEEGRLVGSLRSEYKQALEREQELSGRVEGLKHDLIDLRGRSIRYNILQREVDTSRSLYDGLLQRYKEIGIAGGVGTNNISIVDKAVVPQAPSSPRPLINLALGLIAGVALGILLAIGLDQIDEKITDPSEMEQILGVPSLGVVPNIETDDPIAVLQDRRSAVTEAYLTIKTNLQFATPHGVPRSLLVTSTRASEGKSTTSLALSMVLARQGLKVCTIDADMRSPSLHGIVGIGNDVGLSSVLSRNARWQDVVRDTEIGSFKCIAAGPHPPNAADLLSGPWLRMLIEEILTEFDHVVIDAPPLLGLADAPLIASNVGGVVYVVEAYGVPSRSAKLAINRLLNSGAVVLGAVLTKFSSKKASYGYGYDYGYGYGSADREKSDA